LEWKDYDANNERIVYIPNRLSHDVEYEALALLKRAEDKIGHLYPKDERGNKPIAYYWARTATCSNPSCGAEVPLLKQFYLANTSSRKVHLKPIINGTEITFQVVEGVTNEEGWLNRANLTCPCCGNITPAAKLKPQFKADFYRQRLLAVIWDQPGSGKSYRLPRSIDISAFPDSVSVERPREKLSVDYTQALPSCTWGLEEWGQMFSDRQLLAMQTLVECMPDNLKIADEGSYEQGVAAYLGILINRAASRQTSFGIYHVKGEKVEHPFGRQAIPMVFDYPEASPFSEKSGGVAGQLRWIVKYIEEESNGFDSQVILSASGEKGQFESKSLNAVITDPPYYDAIAYADLSDFFYVWFKRTLAGSFPMNFITPQTPKADECTALKHHHDGSGDAAEKHFENTLQRIFEAIEHQTDGVVSIMFAHQSTKAWTTLCNSILGANMNLMASWAADSELTTALKANKAFLSSAVTVAAKPTVPKGVADYSELKRDINGLIQSRVKELYGLGFRGADLLTACFGHAVSVFGAYGAAEKADGSEVQVAELLDFTREAAFNAIVSDFRADEPTRFYIGWLNLYGFSKASHDDVNKIIQIGLSIDTTQFVTDHILNKTGSHQQLMNLAERMEAAPKIGNRVADHDIDKCHRMMHRWKLGDRVAVVELIGRFAPVAENELWRVMNSLYEVLPKGSDDHKQAGEILSSLESLLRDAKQSERRTDEQQTMNL
jgi:adenine-specific DNA methylase